LRHGVREELLELVKLPNIGRKRARALYNAGFKNVEAIANAKPAELLKVEGIGAKILDGIYRYLGIEKRVSEKPRRKGTLEDFLR
jgi:helicase